MAEVETRISPPVADEDDDGDLPSTRINVSVIDPTDAVLDAAVQLSGSNATDPQALADGLLRTALAVAHLHGPDTAWAAMETFTRYQGGRP